MNDQHNRKCSVSHGEILKSIWKNLDLGSFDRHHPFHTPVFGTIGHDLPELRTVVLRRFWRKPARLAFHVHLGSPKVAQIIANPNVCWLFYHPHERFQLKIHATATIHTDGPLHEEQWVATELFSRRCYIGAAPTQISDKPTTGLPGNLVDRKPTPEESETGKTNFGVVVTAIRSIDCYELNVKGHRRSFFDWRENGELATKWLTP